MRPSPTALTIAFGLLCVGGARAELVVLDDGDVLKVASFEAQGDSARLTLKDGGVMTLPMLRVDRVLENEVEDPVPVVAGDAPTPPRFAVEFDAAQAIPTSPYGGMIYAAAKENALNPELVAAVVRAESDFNPRAYSHKGACGLMQLMPSTGQRFGVQWHDLFDAQKNLNAGARYLKWLVDRFQGDLTKVLAAYNAGEGSVDRYSGVPPYRETRDYVRRIYAQLGLVASTS
jgi:soluble lytic murein transglycosylase-like protein